MATASLTTPLNKCPLCTADQCIMPKELPTCGHIFCRACILTYACVYNDNNESSEGLKCPSCGLSNEKPKDVDTETWIDTLNNTESAVEDKPSSNQEVECVSCKSLGRSEKAVKYCLNCMDSFCHLCLKICHTLEPLRHHKFIEIDNTFDKSVNEVKLLRKMSSLALCSSHPNETIKFHCRDDDTFCCTVCVVADHRKCNKVVEIEKEVIRENLKGEMACIKTSVSKVLHFANDTMEKLKACVETQQKQVDNVAEHITAIKDKINKVLDELEIKCNEKANNLTSRETLRIQDEIRRLGSEVESLETHATLMAKTDEYGSASQQYIATIKCQEKLKDFESFLMEMTSDFKSINISFQQEKILNDVLNIDLHRTTKLGSVEEIPDNTFIPIYNSSTKLKSYSISKAAEETVKDKHEIPTYSSGAFLPDSSLVLIDAYHDSGHCLVTIEAGDVISSCDFESCGADSGHRPYYVTIMNHGTIAVTIPDLKKICFVTTTGGQLKATDMSIQTKYEPKAICGLRNGDIAVAWNNPVAFGVIAGNIGITEKVYFVQDKSGRKLVTFNYMAVDERRSHVVQPCTTDKAVYCFDFKGNPKFKYTNSKLQNPRGVAMDVDGNIYVCEKTTNAIHMVSPTGSANRIIKDGCPECPLAISFNTNGDKFAITRLKRDYRLITFFRVQRT